MPFTSISKFLARLSYRLYQVFWAPASLGVKAFHLLVALSMLMPNFLGVVQLAQAASSSAASEVEPQAVQAGLTLEELSLRAQENAQAFSVQATPVPTGPIEYQQPGITSEAEPNLNLPTVTEVNVETEVIGPAGGTVVAKEGQVQVVFAANVVSETLEIRVSDPVGETGPRYSLSGQPFRLTAYEQASGAPVTQFSSPITVTVVYSETQFAGHEADLSLYYYDPAWGTWIPLPSRVDPEMNTLKAQTDHFTDFDIDVNSWQSAQLPSLQGFQVSSFTGASTYSYPIWVPPGPGGLQPSVSLSYNSQTVDSATAHTQASWVGMGWSLDVGQIERNMNGTNNDVGDDTFNLVVNGVSSMLLPIEQDVDNNDTTTDYRMSDETFWRVRYFHGNYDNPNDDYQPDSWVAWDKQGNRYIFGEEGNDKAQYSYYNYDGPDPDDPCQTIGVVWRWGLSKSINIHNQTLSYDYAKETHSPEMCDEEQMVNAALYPAAIYYPGYVYGDDSTYTYRVAFTNSPRWDFDPAWEEDASFKFFMRSRLAQIQVQRYDVTAEKWNDIRRYVLTYATDEIIPPQTAPNLIFPNLRWNLQNENSYTLTLEKIQEFGLNGSSLPATEFFYDGAHLNLATNGYGGWVDFVYDEWHETNVELVEVDEQDLSIALEGRRLVQEDLCHPDNDGDMSTGGWADINGEKDENVRCWRETPGQNGQNDGNLRIDGNIEDEIAQHEIQKGNLQPGGIYILRARVTRVENLATTIRFGVFEGDDTSQTPNHWGSTQNIQAWNGNDTWEWYETTIWLPYTAEIDAKLRIECDGACLVEEYYMLLAPTRYRAMTKTLNAGTGEEYSFNYCYTDNFVTSMPGNCQGNDTGKTSWPELRYKTGENPFSEDYSDFNGHEYVTVFAPNGAKTVTKFCQKDFCDAAGSEWNPADPDSITSTKGQAKWAEVYGSDGVLYSRTETHYAVSYQSETPYMPYTLLMPADLDEKDPDGNFADFYTGLDGIWSRLEAQVSATCDEAGDCLKTRSVYEYNLADQGGENWAIQFGNTTRTRTQFWNIDTWDDYRMTVTWYYPNLDHASAGPYLVGLPAATNQYQCPQVSCASAPPAADLLASTLNLYDGNQGDYRASPIEGKLTAVRTLLDQEGSTYWYGQTNYTYDDWGNSETVTTYPEYITPFDHQGPPTGARTTTNVYDTAYHTYLEEVRGATYHPVNFPGTTFGYDKDKAVVTSLTDSNGNTTTAEYDAFGRLTEVRKPGDEIDNPDSNGESTISIEYNDDDGVAIFYPFYTLATQKIDDTGKEISVQKLYDGMGRMIQTIAFEAELSDNACSTDGDATPDLCSIFVDYTYNDAGQPATQTIPYTFDPAMPPPSPSQTITTYDLLGRVDTVTAPDTTTTTYDYDINAARQSLISVTDANGNTTVTKNDIWGQTVRVEPPVITAPGDTDDHPAIDYEYDTSGRLTGVDKDSLHTDIQYDLAGRKVYMNDPDMGVWTYDYDALGNLKTQTDANGVIISFTYDDLNRLETKTYDTSANQDITSPGNVTYHYDQGGAVANALGQRTSMEDGTGVTTWSYDERGRVVDVTRSFYSPTLDFLEGPYTFHYTYNKANMVVNTTYPDGEIVTNHYTENGMPKFLTSVLNPGAPEPEDYTYVNSAHYDALGRMTDLTLGNNLTSTYGYYAFSSNNAYDGRLESITINSANDTLLNLVYNEYDAVGNIKKITDNASNGGTQTRIFTYDALSRLQTADATTASGGNLPEYHESFDYDALGRLDSKTEEGVTSTYAYDPNHPHAATALGNDTSYQYDDNGNMIFRREDGIIYHQKWTADNKLYRVNWAENNQNYQTTFVYDGDGNRLLKIEKTPFDEGTSETTTLYLGGLYEQEFDTTEENLSVTWQTAYFPGAGMFLVSAHGATMVSFTPPIWNYGMARLNQAIVEFADKLRGWGHQVQANWQAFWTQVFPKHETAQGEANAVVEAQAESPGADWLATAYAGIAEQEYFVTAAGEAYQAPNRAQDVRTHFAADGTVSWTERTREAAEQAWELAWTLVGVGHETALQPVGEPHTTSSEANRFTYTYAFGGRETGLTEWYLNIEQGVEQGFTLASRPPGEGWLILEGATNLQVVGDNQAVLTEDGVVVLTYGGLKAWDAAGKALEARLEGTAEGLRILVADANAVYPITVDPLVQTPDLVVGEQANAQLGFSVNTAGDVNGDGYADVIVGAPFYDGGFPNAGAAFVYHGGANGLSTTHAWSLEGEQAEAYLGRAVATAGNINGDEYSDVIIGIEGYTSQLETATPEYGKVVVYYGSAAGISGAPAWSASGTQQGAAFGASLTTLGDVNGDGCSDVAVGAYLHTSGGSPTVPHAGRITAYYSQQCQGLSLSPSRIINGEQENSGFGYALAYAGDVNGDGHPDLLVGAPYFGQDNEFTKDEGWESENDIGKVYLFTGNASQDLDPTPFWTQVGGQADGLLGFSVGAAGDVNGDGFADLIAGAPLQGASAEGAVYVYHGAALNLSLEDTLIGSQAGAQFGYAVNTAGDVNGDGYAELLIGAPFFQGTSTEVGKVSLYYGAPQALSSTPAWAVQGSQTSRLGFAVSAAGDVNGDGFADLVVGAPAYNPGNQPMAGQFQIYYGGPDTPQTSPAWTSESAKNGAQWGYAANATGDYNGDGYADLVIGAPYYTNGHATEGQVTVYYGTAQGWGSTPDRAWEINKSTANFGYAVAPVGDVNGDGYTDLAVGAPNFTSGQQGQTQEGKVFVYLGSASGLGSAAAWTMESNQGYAWLGQAVSAAGDVNGDGYADVLVGAPGYDGLTANGGRVFLYLGNQSGLSASPAWTAESDVANAMFGGAVSAADVNGDGYRDVIIGAWKYNKAELQMLPEEGAVFIYYGTPTGPGTTYSWARDGLQANANFGKAVAGGDVNGDGYADVLIGAPKAENGLPVDEGMAYLYLGSAAGVSPTPIWTAEGQQADAQFGTSVHLAGDLNGDGLADALIGSPYTNGTLMDEGATFLYYGTSQGLSGAPAWNVTSGQANARMGMAVGAGDGNGDGYADVIAGVPLYDPPAGGVLTNVGQVQVYYANGGPGFSLHPQIQQETDEVTWPVAPLSLLDNHLPYEFKLEMEGQTPFGCGRVRLEVEAKPQGTLFDGTALYTSEDWVNPCTASVATLHQLVEDLSEEYTFYHWRARIAYHPADFPFQQHSRWVSQPWRGWEEAAFRTNENTHPTSTHTLNGTVGPDGNWFVGAVEITLEGADPLPENGKASGLVGLSYFVGDVCKATGPEDEKLWVPYTGPFTITEDGTHTLCYRAYDLAGNVQNPPNLNHTFAVDGTRPQMTVSVAGLGPNGVTRFDPAIVTLYAQDPAPGAGQAGSGIALVQYRVDSAPDDPWLPYTGAFAITGDGPHTLEYQAWDVAGNWLPPETLAFEMDASAPRILELLPAPFALTNDATPTLSFKVDHSGSGLPAAVTMYLDGKEVTPGSATLPGGNPVIYTFIPTDPLLDGTHTIYVLAEDMAGNRTETFWQFTVDSYTWVEVLAPFEGAVSNREAVTLTLGTEPGQWMTITVHDLANQGSGAIQTYTTTNGTLQIPGWPLASATHQLQITAEDPAGNLAQTNLTLMYNPAVHTAQVSASPDVFKVNAGPLMGAPNRPQVAFQAQVIPTNVNWRLTGWEIRLYPEGSQTPLPILTHLSTRFLPAAGKAWMVNWDGRLENGQPAPEGVYTYQLVAFLTLGQTGQTQAVSSPPGMLVLDSTPPAVPTLTSIPASTGVNNQTLVWFRYAVAVWGEAPGAEWVMLSYTETENGAKEVVQIPVRVMPDGTWFANLPLTEGQLVYVFATAVDAAGNQSGYSAGLYVGLAHENIFETPFATVSPLQIGVDMDVTLNATVRAGGADLAWVAASLPVEPYHLGLIPAGSQTYTGTWHTPLLENYQGVALMVFQALDTATPPILDEVLVTPYLDLIPPWIAIHQPANGYIVGGQTMGETALLTVTGVAEPYSMIEVIALPEETGEAPTPGLLGYANSDGTGAWTTTLVIPLAGFVGGRFVLTAQATDLVGNLGSVATAQITLDFAGPVIDPPWAVPMYLNPTLPGVDSTTVHVNLHDAETGVAGASGVVYGVPDENSVSQPEDFFPETINLFGLQLEVPDSTVEGKKDIQITAWDWVFNSSILTATAFIVDKTSPTLTNLTLTALGENLYTPDPQTVWHGPASDGQTLRVSVTVNDENPPLDWTEVAGVAFVTFPPGVLTAGDGGTVDAQAAVYDTQVSKDYTASQTPTQWTPTVVTATDRAGNLSAASGFTVLWDDIWPELNTFQLELDNTLHVYPVPGTHTFYYGPNAEGILQVSIQATDAGAGMRHVRFPGFPDEAFYDVKEPLPDHTYGRTYEFEGATASREDLRLVAFDNVGNQKTSPASFAILRDAQAPEVTLALTPIDAFHYQVTWAIEETGSGLASYTVQVCQDALPCEDLVSNPGVSGSLPFTAEADHSYLFRIQAQDHVDNETTQEEALNTASITKYYLFGGQRVAMRVGTGPQSAVYYLHGDHLGSVSMSTNALGEIESQMRFTPFGEELTVAGSENKSPTDFGFTGQRNDGYIKLLDYGARWYDARLGRFLSADSIIPGAGNPMAWDRFSYAFNNPIRYNDPSGHCGADSAQFGEEDQQALEDECNLLRDQLQDLYEINIEGSWKLQEMKWLSESLDLAAGYFGGVDNLKSTFKQALENKGSSNDKLTFLRSHDDEECHACWDNKDTITIGDLPFQSDYINNHSQSRPPSLGLNNVRDSIQITILHEIGHVVADARPELLLLYRIQRQWNDPSGLPGDGGRAFAPGAPEESFATAFAVAIKLNGLNYPRFKEEIAFMVNYQPLFQASSLRR